MKKILTIFCLVIISSVLAACSTSASPSVTPPAPATPPPASQPQASPSANGEKLYQANCSACHGPSASGGMKLGDETVPDIRAKSLADTYHGDISLMKRAILNGADEKGGTLGSSMPRWSNKLSDAEVTAIIKYLQTLN